MRAAHILVILFALGSLAGGLWYVLQQGAVGESVPAPLAGGVSPVGSERAGPPLERSERLLPGEESDAGREASPVETAPAKGTISRAARGGGDRTVRGRVVDEFATPVAAARVLYTTSRGTEGLRLEDAVGAPSGWFDVQETTTDAAGEFELVVRQRGDLRLAARAPGFAPLREERALLPSGETRLEDLVLLGAVSLAGHVVDLAGGGIAGASLHELAPEDGGFRITLHHDGGEALAVTDSGGAFTVDQLAAGPFRLRVRHPEHPDLVVRGTTDRPGAIVTGLRYVMEDGLEISGSVLGLETGQHVALAVRATPVGSDLADPVEGYGRARTAEISAGGTFVISGVRRDRSYRLQAIEAAEALHAYFAEPRSAGVVARSGEGGVELELREASGLAFQVVDERSGEVLTTFQVEAGRPWIQVLRDEAGTAILEHPGGRVRYPDVPLRAGETEADLCVRAEGYETLLLEDLALEAGVERDLGVLRLEPVPAVTVRVFDAENRRPLRGARVVLRGNDPTGSGAPPFNFEEELDSEDSEELLFPEGDDGARRGRTDAEGVAVLSGLPGRHVRLTVRQRGFAVHRGVPFLLSAAEPAELEVLLRRGGTVIVRVQEAGGAPVPGQDVVHRQLLDEAGSRLRGGPGDSLKSREDGTAVFARLSAGTHHFALREESGGVLIGGAHVVLAGQEDLERDDGGVDVFVGEGTTETITLQVRPRGTLNGQVTEGGEPLAGATLTIREVREEGADDLYLAGLGGVSARTDGEGRYAFEGLKIGDYTVRIAHPTRAMADEREVSLPEGVTGRDFALSVTRVEGRVLDSEGRPVPGVVVRPRRVDSARPEVMLSFRPKDGGGALTFSTGPSAKAVTDDGGGYFLRGVPTGVELQVHTSSDEYEPGRSESFQLSDDQTLRGVDVEVRKAGSIQLIVVRADGSLETYSLVELTFLDEPLEPRRAYVGESGRTTIHGLRPGRWRVDVPFFDLESGPTPLEVEVRAGETVQATVTWP